jgi:4a-hydroxytetrahydrobiopterin dehydratase
MTTPTAEELARKSCVPCEGGIPALSSEQAQALLANVRGWELADDGRRIRRRWVVRNFPAGIDFIDRIAIVAEEQGHHPDVHLEGYRNVTIELWTHAINGLSENDFILAARINELPVELKRGRD